jgi:hypothetical protein
VHLGNKTKKTRRLLDKEWENLYLRKNLLRKYKTMIHNVLYLRRRFLRKWKISAKHW